MTNDKNKGFTLIELLAVIVILAVIALIAVPRIIEILNKAKISAAEDSTYGIVEAAESYVADFMLQNQGAIPSEDLEFECGSEGCILTNILEGYDTTNLDKLNYKGKKVSSGNITISNSGNNIITTNLNINNFVCSYLDGESSCVEKKEVKPSGTAIYFDPIKGEECNNYEESQSTTGVVSGCMQWYVLNDSETSAVYNLLLDHNISSNVAWNSSYSNLNGPKEVMNGLKAITENWIGVPKRSDDYSVELKNDNSQFGYTINYDGYRARLIKTEEIVKITGKTGFDIHNDSTWFHLDTNTQEIPNWLGEATSKYAWLYNHLYGCLQSGCSQELLEDIAIGYWTSDANLSISSEVWSMMRDGYLTAHLTGPATPSIGIRPVITISKSLIKN